MDHLPDEKIIRGILDHDSRVLREIYAECLPMVERMIINTGGDRDQARDVFQEAMIIIFRKLTSGELELTCRFSTYLYGISKKVWMQEKRKWLTRMKSHTPGFDQVEEPQTGLNDEVKIIRQLFYKHFRQLSPECQKIMILHFNKVTIEEIGKILKKQDSHYVMDRKYRCKKSLINRILNDPNYKTIKNEYSEQIRTLF
jgi:RNA polymerase sigma factor (sigma-70 family)